VNIDYPFHFDASGKTASCDTDAHIRDMIEQFLFTNHGERVNRPDFGSGLMQFIFAPNSPEVASALEFTIQAGLQRWLGDLIDVTELQVTAEDSSLKIVINYVVHRANQSGGAANQPQTALFTRTV
jgi:phage baseplate assembly protein W